MSMSETYSAEILELVLREFLKDGVVPTADLLTGAYQEYIKNHQDLTKPFIIDEDYTVVEGEESSVKKYNGFFERVLSDLNALYIEIWDRTKDSMNSAEKWQVKLERLRKRLISLEFRMDSLLLTRHDTAGYFNFVEDCFVDFSKIDQVITTGKIDIEKHMITISEDNIEGNKIDLNSLPVSDITFNILTRSNMVAVLKSPGTELVDAVQDTNHAWLHRVFTNTQSDKISAELKVKLAEVPIELVRIEMKLHSANNTSACTIVGQYSSDDYNWFNLPTLNYVQTTDDDAIFIFPKTSMQWVRLVLTKIGADDFEDGQFIYEFGASELKFFSSNGYKEGGSILQSKELQALDVDGNPVKFNQVALEACQNIPSQTSILYWVKAKNSELSTEFIRIDPYNIDNPVAQTVVEFGKLTTTSDRNIQNLPKDEDKSKEYFAQYKDVVRSDNIILLGRSPTERHEITEEAWDRIAETSLVLYRNVGESGIDTLVRGVRRGWFEDSAKAWYSTFIVIGAEDGLRVNLGTIKLYLDEIEVTGIQVLTKGTHRIRVKEIDIESIDDIICANVDLFCERICSRINVSDLLYNTPNSMYDKYATDIYISEGIEYTVFLVRYDANDSSYQENEEYIVSYKLEDSSGEDKMFDTIVFKAQLLAENTVDDVTPQLTAYRIKLGI